MSEGRSGSCEGKFFAEHPSVDSDCVTREFMKQLTVAEWQAVVDEAAGAAPRLLQLLTGEQLFNAMLTGRVSSLC